VPTVRRKDRSTVIVAKAYPVVDGNTNHCNKNGVFSSHKLKPGERVVVTATGTKGKDGKATLVATEVRLGAANTAASK
jgi:hypothetical protein